MQHISLNGSWSLTGGDYADIPAVVPGNIHSALLAAGKIADPYFRDQELDALWIGDTDWDYTRTFTVGANLLAYERVLLRCDGLDTLATLTLNGQMLATTDNMFRTYAFDVKDKLQVGENIIKVHFQAPVPYAKAKLEARYLHNWGVDRQDLRKGVAISGHKLPGGNYLRKEPCNFGWDWGPMVPTCGIWRDITLVAFNTARLNEVQILQNHSPDRVSLTVNLRAERTGDVALQGHVSLSLAGASVAEQRVAFKGEAATATLDIPNPHLWWPNGLGDQPLYQLEATLLGEGGEPLDICTKMIGLRTLRLVREADEWGESFHFAVNGVPFFSKGANWIPADSFLDRLTVADYERLIRDTASANMNMLRVWGGGIYEPDLFYDLCDRYGICIWQDFMFSCATYPTFDEAWLESVHYEAEDNVRRLRHHACLALWCGNNELEQGLVGPETTETTMSWAEYGLLFDEMLPEIVGRLDPQTDYWPCSPHTPSGDRHNFNDPTNGDAHIWSVWHGLEPFEFYRTCFHRFNSEFGFQSFPEPRTVDTYTDPQDRNITTFVMEHHQRSLQGNQRIMHYMLDWFRLPTSFESTLWLSQIQQGMAIKYAVEHWRRTMPRGMGTLYWQLNDCWPVASWASIDYYGRWKALHYMARHFFAPLLVSGLEDWETGAVETHVTSDQRVAARGEITWSLLTVTGEVVAQDHLPVEIAPLANTLVTTLQFGGALAQYGRRTLMLHLDLRVGGISVSNNLVLFCRPKHLDLTAPNFSLDIAPAGKGTYTLTLTADQIALWVWLETATLDVRYGDNFFHLRPAEPLQITLTTADDPGLAAVKQAISVHSLIDTFA